MGKTTFFRNTQTEKVVFFLCLSVALFWSSVVLLDVYRFEITGAIYEILWLPMLVLIYTLPFVVLIFLFKTKFNLRTLYVYALLLLALTAVVIWFNS